MAVDWLFNNQWDYQYMDLPSELRTRMVGYPDQRGSPVLPLRHLKNCRHLIVGPQEHGLLSAYPDARTSLVAVLKPENLQLMLDIPGKGRQSPESGASSCVHHPFTGSPQDDWQRCRLCSWMKYIHPTVYLIDIEVPIDLCVSHCRFIKRHTALSGKGTTLIFRMTYIRDAAFIEIDNSTILGTLAGKVRHLVFVLQSDLPRTASHRREVHPSGGGTTYDLLENILFEIICEYDFSRKTTGDLSITFAGFEEEIQEELAVAMKGHVRTRITCEDENLLRRVDQMLGNTRIMGLKEYSETLKGVQRSIISDAWWRRWEEEEALARTGE